MKDNNAPETVIIKFTGQPNEFNDPNESTRWHKFRKLLGVWAEKTALFAGMTKYLSEAYVRAETNKTNAQADKFAAEASEAAARGDHQRQETMIVVNDELRKIFETNLPPEALQLQLANLIAVNPQIAEQLEKIAAMYRDLKIRCGTEVQLISGPPESSKAGEEAEKPQESIRPGA